MKVIENKTKYAIKDIIQMAKRDNNKKRSYLFVNPVQAKHIPVSPKDALKLFEGLGEELRSAYSNEKSVIIGFAETATAIGAAVANCFGEDTYYIHTTREEVKDAKVIVNFEEEHSHATEQKLYCHDPKEVLVKAQRIIFVEDEVTTGKTILNFIDALKKNGYIKKHHKIAIASIVNSMQKMHLEAYQNMHINIHYLIKIEYEHKEDQFDLLSFTREGEKEESSKIKQELLMSIKSIQGKTDPRVCVKIDDYQKACKALAEDIIHYIGKDDFKDKKILVLGTEEFMYPAIYLGYEIEKRQRIKNVRVHATTRSPIMANLGHSYPIKNKTKLMSFYERDRQTFIYNLAEYDKAIIVTDAQEGLDEAFYSLGQALYERGCKDILGIRWVE